jgi:hypothetical protein
LIGATLTPDRSLPSPVDRRASADHRRRDNHSPRHATTLPEPIESCGNQSADQAKSYQGGGRGSAAPARAGASSVAAGYVWAIFVRHLSTSETTFKPVLGDIGNDSFAVLDNVGGELLIQTNYKTRTGV